MLVEFYISSFFFLSLLPLWNSHQCDKGQGAFAFNSKPADSSKSVHFWTHCSDKSAGFSLVVVRPRSQCTMARNTPMQGYARPRGSDGWKIQWPRKSANFWWTPVVGFFLLTFATNSLARSSFVKDSCSRNSNRRPHYYFSWVHVGLESVLPAWLAQQTRP